MFAADLIRSLVASNQGDAALQLELGIQLTYLGEAELKFDKAQHAYQSFEIAVVCFEECVALAPDPPMGDPVAETLWRSQDATRRYFEAYNAYSLGLLLTRANQSLTAREYWTRSLDLFEGLVQEWPNSMKFRQRYAQAVSNEGSRLAAGEGTSGALQVFTQAGDLYSELVDDAPWDATNQHGLAMALGNQAMLLAVEQRHPEALEVARRSLDVWETYVGMRPDDPPAFRQAVVWKTAELLAHQAAAVLPDDPDKALALAMQEQELVTEDWDESQLLQESTTLHALEIALAEAEFRRIEDFPDQAEEWLPVLEGLIGRLQARRPEDADVLALKEQLDTLRMTPQ